VKEQLGEVVYTTRIAKLVGDIRLRSETRLISYTNQARKLREIIDIVDGKAQNVKVNIAGGPKNLPTFDELYPPPEEILQNQISEARDAGTSPATQAAP